MFSYLGKLLFSMEGRIARKRFWFGLFLLTILSIGLTVTAGSLSAEVLTAFLVVCVFSKRLHDRNKTALAIYFYFAISVLDESLLKAGLYTYPEEDAVGTGSFSFFAEMITSSNLFYTAIGWVNLTLGLVIAFYLLIQCGFLKGTPGENSYGPSPLVVNTDG